MKKLTASLISVILLLMLASCKTIGNFGNTADFNSDQFLERYDHNQAWTHLTARFCKAGNTIFLLILPIITPIKISNTRIWKAVSAAPCAESRNAGIPTKPATHMYLLTTRRG